MTTTDELASIYAGEIRAAVRHDRLLRKAGMPDDEFVGHSFVLRALRGMHEDIARWRIDGQRLSDEKKWELLKLVAVEVGITEVQILLEPSIALSNSAYMLLVSYVGTIIRQVK